MKNSDQAAAPNSPGTQTDKAVAPSPASRSLLVYSLRLAIGYCAVSCLTLPFIGRVWLGEMPVLALLQCPKTRVADFFRRHVVMEALPPLGLSRGSFSPDYVLARPYGLAIAYLLPILVFTTLGLRHRDQQRRRLTAIFLFAAIIDYWFTLGFSEGSFLSIY